MTAAPSEMSTAATSLVLTAIGVVSRSPTAPPPQWVASRLAEAPWRRSFEPASEWDRVECAVEGEGALPPELRGVLYRNGAGRIRVGEARYAHWFDGDGLVSRLELDGSRVARSSARYVRTPRFLAQEAAGGEAAGRMAARGAWTLRGDGGMLDNAMRLPTNPANTNVQPLPPEGRLHALCEGGTPIELDARTLATTGREWNGGGALKSALPGLPPTTFSAHCKRDPVDGCVYNFGLDYGVSLALHLLRCEPDGSVASAAHALRTMPLYHDLSITRSHVVLTRTPFELTPANVMRSMLGTPALFEWSEGAPSVLELFDKRTLQPVAAVRLPQPLSCYHHVGAWEEPDGSTTLIIEAHNSARVDVETALADMYSAWFTPELECSLWRVRVDTRAPGGGRVLESARLEAGGRATELPCANERFTGWPLRYAYCNALGETCGCLQDIEKVDLTADGATVERYSPGEGRYCGEAVFVPRAPPPEDPTAPPDPATEDDGWLLAYVYDSHAHASELVVLDARALSAGPRWHVRLPAHVPPSFHGCWLPAAE